MQNKITNVSGASGNLGKAVVRYFLNEDWQVISLAHHRNKDIKKKIAVKVFVVVPSTIDTPQNRKAMPDADFSKWEPAKEIAEITGRFSELEDNKNTGIEIIVQSEL